jgi:hypothetical protein
MEIETEVYNMCQKIVKDLVEELKISEYYLTNSKLDFLTDLLRKQIEKRDGNARGAFDIISRKQKCLIIFRISFSITYTLRKINI